MTAKAISGRGSPSIRCKRSDIFLINGGAYSIFQAPPPLAEIPLFHDRNTFVEVDIPHKGGIKIYFIFNFGFFARSENNPVTLQNKK